MIPKSVACAFVIILIETPTFAFPTDSTDGCAVCDTILVATRGPASAKPYVFMTLQLKISMIFSTAEVSIHYCPLNFSSINFA